MAATASTIEKSYEKFVDEFWFYDPKEHRAMSEGDYVKLAVFGECGEIAEKIKKYYRGDVELLDSEAMVGEVGDLLYYLVKLSHLVAYSIEWELTTRNYVFKPEDPGSAALNLCQSIGVLVWLSGDTGCPGPRILQCLRYLERFANSIDSSLVKAMHSNIEKLNSRRRRGTLRGSGDGR